MADNVSENTGNYLLLTRLADEFAARYRAGERPALQEYVDRYPELADDIRELFPAMVEIEQVCEDHQASVDQAAPPPVPALQQLGDFRILREVGKGGMGIVYEAEQVSLGRHVALKVLPLSLLPDARAKRRFEREAKSAARLHHTNIVPVFGVGEQDGLPYYVMQFIQGLGLDAVLEELQKLQTDPARTGTVLGGGLRVSRNGGPGAPVPAADPTGVQRSVAIRSVADQPRNPAELSATYIAHSLLSGGFDAATAVQEDPVAANRGAAPEAASRTPSAAPWLSDSFTLSSSSVVLPARGRDGSKSRSRKSSYWQSVASIGLQVAEALEYAHKQGVLHRDIKPSNLLLDTQGTVWVADFGLAKSDDQENLTHSGDILGTLRYMPPEAFEGQADARSDVYALGLTLYEMLAFRPAFDEKDRHRLIKQVTQAEPTRLGKLNRQVPQDLQTIIHKAIDKDPQQRYASAAALAEDLQCFLADEPIKARRVNPTERFWRWCRRNPLIAGLAGAVAGLLLLATGILSVSVVHIAAARDNESTQRRQAEDSAEESRKRLVLANVTGGASLLEQGDLQSALPWFAEALRLDQGDPDREANHRLRLAATLHHAPRLVALWSTEAGPGRVAICPDGRRVAVCGSHGLTVWDLDSGRPVWTVAQGAAVNDFAFSPAGQHVATAGQDGIARVWNLETGAAVTPPLAHQGPINQVSFSEDGLRLATASDDRTARLWDSVTGECCCSLVHDEVVQSAAFRPNGQQLVTRSRGLITVWETASGQRGPQIFPDTAWIQDAKFSSDGRQVITTGIQRILRSWNPDNGAVVALNSQSGTAWLSPDRRLAVTGYGLGSTDRPSQVLDLQTGLPVTPPLENTQGTVDGIFSPQGNRLMTTGADGTVRVWAVETAEIVAGPIRHSAAVTSTGFSPDGRLIVTRETTGLVRVWDMASSAAPDSRLKSAMFNSSHWGSADGRWLMAGTPGGSLWLWDTQTGLPVTTVYERGWVMSAAISSDGSRLLTAHRNGIARIWEAATGQPVAEPLVHTAPVLHVEFSPDGRLAVSASEDRTACVWDAATGQRISQIEHPAAVRWAAFSPDSRQLVTATGDYPKGVSSEPEDRWARDSKPAGSGEARVWDAATGQPVTPWIHHEGVVQRAVFSPDGRSVLTTSIGRPRTADPYQVQVWEVASGDPVTIPLGHPQTVLHETFSPDGRLVATACLDGGVRVWDAVTGQLRPFVARHNTAVSHVAFSADAGRLLSAGNDGTARLWDATNGQPMAVLRHPRGLSYALFAPDGQTILTVCIDLSARRWQLEPDQRPVADWIALAQVLSGDGRGTNPDSDQQPDTVAIWQSLRNKYPANFATTPAEQQAWHRHAVEIAMQQQNWSAALPYLVRLIDLDPSNWQDRLTAARLLARLERWGEAEAAFDRACERHPTVSEVWVARGSFFLARGQADRAAADFSRVIDLRGTSGLPAVLSEFWIAGLYPQSLNVSSPPELQLDPSRPIPPSSESDSRLSTSPAWRAAVTEASGFLNLAEYFQGAEHASAYALACVYSQVEQEAVLLSGSDDGLRLWLNGRPIYAARSGRAPAPDQDRVLVKLRQGWNTVLAKVANDTGQHGLFLRLSADPSDLAAVRTHQLELVVHAQAKAIQETAGNVIRADVTAVDDQHWHVQLSQDLYDMREGGTYTVRFRARAAVPREVQLYAQVVGLDWHCIGLDVMVPLTADWQTYEYQFQAQTIAADQLILFNIGERIGSVWVADFTITETTQ